MPEPRSILILGLAPEAVDYADPDLPPGITAEKVAAGLGLAQREIMAAGGHADLCLLQLDGSAMAMLARQLDLVAYDCIVVGGGLRKVDANIALFEAVIDMVRRHAPAAVLAFNTRPEDSAASAARALSSAGR